MCYRREKLLYPADKLGKLTKHHRKPTSIGGKRAECNISYVPEKLHQAYHLLFANDHAPRIAKILNNHWIDADYVMVAVPVEDMDKVRNVLLSNNY